MVQWLKLHTVPKVEGMGLIPGQETRSHMQHLIVLMLQLKIMHAATKTQHCQNKTKQNRTKPPTILMLKNTCLSLFSKGLKFPSRRSRPMLSTAGLLEVTELNESQILPLICDNNHIFLFSNN